MVECGIDVGRMLLIGHQYDITNMTSSRYRADVRIGSNDTSRQIVMKSMFSRCQYSDMNMSSPI